MLSYAMWSGMGRGEGKGKIENGRYFWNVVNEPVHAIFQPGDVILDRAPPPALHLTLGIVNDAVKRLEQIDRKLVKGWLKHVHLKRSKQWGGHIDGNGCRVLLDHLSYMKEIASGRLDSLDPMEEIVFREIDIKMSEVLLIVSMLESFAQVMHDCFGHELRDSYETSIATFRKRFEALPVRSVTVKTHIIFEHIAPYCKSVGRGLGITAEQAHETLHSYFKKKHARHFVKNPHNPNYGKLLLQTVLEFNAMNCLSID